MTQEDKELLLIDLCARLPHGVCVHIRYKEGEPCYGKLTPKDIQWFIDSKIEVIKPYLRPMSSMTEEERKERLSFFQVVELKSGLTPLLSALKSFEYINWLNAHHFDYRKSYDLDRKEWLSMIEKGLAIKAPAGMYED